MASYALNSIVLQIYKEGRKYRLEEKPAPTCVVLIAIDHKQLFQSTKMKRKNTHMS